MSYLNIIIQMLSTQAGDKILEKVGHPEKILLTCRLLCSWYIRVYIEHSLYFFPTFSEFVKSGCRFSTIRRLHSLGSRESRQALAAITCHHDSSKAALRSSHHHEKSCLRGFSSSSEGKDKTGKGSGNQWSCPKCGNPCTSVERKFMIMWL